jgi:hypothetical protein
LLDNHSGSVPAVSHEHHRGQAMDSVCDMACGKVCQPSSRLSSNNNVLIKVHLL